MIHSIRQFLLISLLISVMVASSITAIGNYLLDKMVVRHYLNTQLIKVASLLETFPEYPIQKILTNKKKRLPSYHDEVLYQIWDKNGKLIAQSQSNAPFLTNAPLGFSQIMLKEVSWHIYATKTAKKNKIIVAEQSIARNKLVDEIASNNMYILLISYPLFGLLIWIIVGLALRSITRVTEDISKRASNYFELVRVNDLPIEIKPLVMALNQLFINLQSAFERNKRFASDAAHELRTPLAALKTQTQVALKSQNKEEELATLQKIVQGVDRCSHIVAQLLTLSRLSQEEELNDIKPVDLHKLATEIIAFLVPLAIVKHIDIELLPPPLSAVILGNNIALGILIRNVVDNAIRYTPDNGEIKIKILNENANVVFRVMDSGPGIPCELKERVFERFYRIPGSTAQGSGLGLAIVLQITNLHLGKIELNTAPSGVGLQFDVIFPPFSYLN